MKKTFLVENYVQSKIDGQTYCTSNGKFKKHLQLNNLSILEYLVKYEDIDIPLCHCGSNCKFVDRDKSFINTCGKRACINHLIKKSHDESYKENMSNLSKKMWENRTNRERKDISRKISLATAKPEKIDRIKNKLKLVDINTDNLSLIELNNIYDNLPDYKKKIINNHSNKIGKEKAKATCLKRYGHEHPSKNKDVIEKIKHTCVSRFGESSIFKTKEFKRKYKEHFLKKYGVEHPMQTPELQEKVSNALKSKFDIKYDVLTEDNYKNSSIKKLANDANCSQSHVIRYLHANDIEIQRKLRSSFEEDVHAYISSKYKGEILLNTRKYGVEFDLYLPDISLAFECNGLYWHCERSGNRNKNYHLNKTKVAENNNIRLVHIWDYKWYSKNASYQFLIDNVLNCNKTIPARKSIIKEITNKEANQFLKNYHRQHQCASSIKYGLFYNNDLVSVMTFGKSRFSKGHQYELLRFASKHGITVQGGASKLFKRFKNDYKPDSIVTYSDRMHVNGNMYSILDFKQAHCSPPAMHYVKNYKTVINRIALQKHKLCNILEYYDSNLTAWENLKKNGYDRFWDCGTIKWEWFKSD